MDSIRYNNCREGLSRNFYYFHLSAYRLLHCSIIAAIMTPKLLSRSLSSMGLACCYVYLEHLASDICCLPPYLFVQAIITLE